MILYVLWLCICIGKIWGNRCGEKYSSYLNTANNQESEILEIVARTLYYVLVVCKNNRLVYRIR